MSGCEVVLKLTVTLLSNDMYIFSRFEVCGLPIYECVFSHMQVTLPFIGFEVQFLNPLVISSFLTTFGELSMREIFIVLV